MSKTLSQFKTAFVGAIALLQLILLPATQVLHLGCKHSHGEAMHAGASVLGAVGTAWSSCWSSHCCDHCGKTAVADNQPTDSNPVHPPHDEDSCPICQAVFAARVATTAAIDLTATEAVREFVAENSQTVHSTPRYRVLSRGPPTASA